ncbi:hypothetical protein [Mesorhizobium sp. M0800]|uniref:hypothetical protein n=1 Tax=Mesorhizobium sp. M0800 TaxID=2957000 RepID=UPI003335A487
MRFDLAQDGETLAVTLVSLPLHSLPQGAAGPLKDPIAKWILPRQAFGPAASFKLSPRHAFDSASPQAVTLKIENVSFGRRRNASMQFKFAYDPDQKNDEAKRQGLWTIVCRTTLWLGEGGGESAFDLGAEPADRTRPGERAEAIPFEDFAKDRELVQILRAPRITQSFKLVFNGLVRAESETSAALTPKALVRLSLNRYIVWTVDGQAYDRKAVIRPFSPAVSADRIRVAWSTNDNLARGSALGQTPQPPDDKLAAPPEAQGYVVVGVAISERDAAASTGEVIDVGDVSIALPAQHGIRGTLRSQSKPRSCLIVASEKERRGTDPEIHRCEAILAGRWSLEFETDDASGSVVTGPFPDIIGVAKRRIDIVGDVKLDDPFAAGDELTFAGASKEIASARDVYDPFENSARVTTPVGGMRVGVLPIETADSRDRTADQPDTVSRPSIFERKPFGEYSAAPIWLLTKGAQWDTANDQRTIEWLEINTLLLESEVSLEDASHSALTFEPTDLVFLFQPDALRTAPRSFVWLGRRGLAPQAGKGGGAAGEPALAARIDLSNARLEAARYRDLVSLKFRFLNLFLVFEDGPRIAPVSQACGIYAKTPSLPGENRGVVRGAPPQDVKGKTGSADEESKPRIAAPQIEDTRPILVVEFPSQHIMEQAFFRPSLTPLPEVVLEPGTMTPCSMAACAWAGLAGGIDASDPNEILRALALLPTVGERKQLRTQVRDLKKNKNDAPAEALKEFSAIAEALSKENGLPEDQRIYIGPYGLDPDAAARLREIRDTKKEEFAAGLIAQMFAAVEEQLKLMAAGVRAKERRVRAEDPSGAFPPGSNEAKLLRRTRHLPDPAPGSPPPPERDYSFEDAIAVEAMLESVVPTYQLFRSFYREAMAVYALGEKLTGGANRPKAGQSPPELPDEDRPTEPDPWQIEFILLDGKGADRIEVPWSQAPDQGGAGPTPRTVRRFDWAGKYFVNHILGLDEYEEVVEGRHANPSRLAFRVNCRDALAEARNIANTPWPEGDAKAAHRRKIKGHLGFIPENDDAMGVSSLPFSLSGLTNWAAMELAVVKRAEQVFAPAPGGRLDARSRRKINLHGSAMLDHLGFLPGSQSEERKWEFRMARIKESLRPPPSPFETSIELPARLVLSPSQRAAFRSPRGIHPGIYGTPGPKGPTAITIAIHNDDGGLTEPRAEPDQLGNGLAETLWHARLMLEEDVGPPDVRAVYSPDLAVDFVSAGHRRLHAKALDLKSNLPGGGAPPRGPYAPWLLSRAETSAQDLAPSEFVDKTPDYLDGKELTDEELCAVDLNEEPARRRDAVISKLPLMIAELCRRWNLRQRPIATRQFRTSLDAFDRHELVVLSSAFGLPVMAKSGDTSEILPGARSGQFVPDDDYKLLDILPGNEIYRPQPLSVSELTLTALGGSLRHDTSFAPPASAKYFDGRNLFDALSIERWQHSTSLGRDVYCEVVYKGYLLPFMFRASMVKVTERVFDKDAHGTMKAYLRQRMFVRCTEPIKDFPVPGHTDFGRCFPPGECELLTVTTPDIVDPNAIEGADLNGLPALELASGRIKFRNAPGLVFWPRTAMSSAADIRFGVRIGKSYSACPMLFVDNVAVNDEETLNVLRHYYNGTLDIYHNRTKAADVPQLTAGDVRAGVPSPDSEKMAPVEPLRHRRTLALSGEKVRYTDEEKTGSASVETDFITLRVEGRRFGTQQPEIVSSAPGDDPADPTVMIEVYKLRGDSFSFDPVLQGAEQPPVYPVVETARVRLKQNEVLTARQGESFRATYDGHYVAKGYLPQENPVEVFLNLIDPASQEMNNNGDQSGGIFQPKGSIVALSRTKGTVASKVRLSKFDPNRRRAEGDRDSLAKLFSATPVQQAAVPGTNAAAPQPDPKRVVKDIFGDSKLLGLVRIDKIIDFIDDTNLGGAGERAPALLEVVRFGAATAAKAEAAAVSVADYIRKQVVAPLSAVVKDAIREWDELDAELRRSQSELGSVLTLITLDQLFPELDGALKVFDRAIDAALETSNEIAFAIALSVVYETGQSLLDAVRRTAANPLERFESAITGRLGELGALLTEKFEDAKSVLANALESLSTKNLSETVSAFVIAGEDNKPFVEIALPLPRFEWLKDEALQGVDQQLAILAEPVFLTSGEARKTLAAMIRCTLIENVKLEDLFDEGQSCGIETPGSIFTSKQSFREFAAEKINERIGPKERAVEKIISIVVDLKEEVKGRLTAEIARARALVAALKSDEIQSAIVQRAVALIREEYAAEYATLQAVVVEIGKAKEAMAKGDLFAAATSFSVILNALFGIDLALAEDLAGLVGHIQKTLTATLAPLRITLVEFKQPMANDCELTVIAGQIPEFKGDVAPDDVEPHLEDPGQKSFIEQLHNGVDELRDSLEDVKNIAVPSSPKELRDAVRDTRSVLTKTLVETGTALAEFYRDLLNDANLTAGLKKTVFGKLAVPAEQFSAESLTSLRPDLRRYVASRKAMLERNFANLRSLATTIRRILTDTSAEHKSTREVIAAAAVGAVVGGVLKDLTVDTKSKVRTGSEALVKAIARQLDSLFRSAQQIVDAIPEGFFDEIRAFVDKLPIPVELAQLKILQDRLAAYKQHLQTVTTGIGEIAAKDQPSFEDLDKIRNLIETFLIASESVPKNGTPPLRWALEVDLEKLFDVTLPIERAIRGLEKEGFEKLDSLAAAALDKLAIAKFYKDDLLKARNALWSELDGFVLGKPIAKRLLLLPDAAQLKIDADPVKYEPADNETNLNVANDRLAGDAAWLEHSSVTTISDRAKRRYLAGFVRDWGDGKSAPVAIVNSLIEDAKKLLRGDINLDDFFKIREQIEAYLLDLIPAKIEYTYDVDLPLPAAVKSATAGIFSPRPGCELKIGTKIEVDLLNPGIEARVVGSLGAFDIKLVGSFDALTLKFRGANFQSRTGEDARFDIAYDDYEIGPELKFLEDLQSYLSPKEGSGAYLIPLRGIPGIEAGYKLDLGIISVGACSFFNVSLNTAALLPFTNKGEALFRASLSRYDSPFTISYLPFGGSGFMSVDANAKGIVGFELGFDFGAAGSFAAGPLTGQGRIMMGLYIRQLALPGVPKVTEISGTFFAGGSANIWVFNFAASLYVRLGMVNGNMTGLAVFSFSFSMGIADFDYSVSFERTESKGFDGGGDQASRDPDGSSIGSRFARNFADSIETASLDGFVTGSTVPAAALKGPVIRSKVVCMSENWGEFSRYFDKITPCGVLPDEY